MREIRVLVCSNPKLQQGSILYYLYWTSELGSQGMHMTWHIFNMVKTYEIEIMSCISVKRVNVNQSFNMTLRTNTDLALLDLSTIFESISTLHCLISQDDTSTYIFFSAD